MRNIFTFILLLPCIFAKAQVNDSFTDGDFENNPNWSGNIHSFIINASNQLQLDTSGTGTKILVTPDTMIMGTEWSFWFKLNFDPSASNFVKIYLTSDSPDLTGSLNGYFIKIGENGSLDGIDLYRQNGLTTTLLINGKAKHAASKPTLRIKIIHENSGEWELYSDTTGKTYFLPEGNTTDNQIKICKWFGILCKFTSSYSGQFFFDDFYAGRIIKDTLPPVITGINMIDSIHAQISFNEAIDTNSIKLANVRVLCGKQVSSVTNTAPNILIVLFLKPFINNDSCTLYITGIGDYQGNRILQWLPLKLFYFIPQTASANDVVIDEIFPDPDPQVGLPDYEFVELFNRSNKVISLKNWSIADKVTTSVIGNYILFPDSFLIICAYNAADKYGKFGKTLGLNTFPALNNNGDDLFLKDEKGNFIYEINYDLSWYGDDYKNNGGWSLEMIDPSNYCTGRGNWSATVDPSGGTPGRLNSVNSYNPDNTQPYITKVGSCQNNKIYIEFSEKMDTLSLYDLKNYILDERLNQTFTIRLNPPYYNITTLMLHDTFIPKTIYHIICKGVRDCSGNKISGNNEFDFGESESPDSSDLVINEILFNPYSGGYDFVELYNRSAKIISLKNMSIASLNDDNTFKDIRNIGDSVYEILPADYLVLTENPDDIIKRYVTKYPEKMISMNVLPPFNDDKGHIIIYSDKGKIIDDVVYNENMHSPMLASKTGVSLERTNPDAPSSNSSNWHSSSSTAGFATPTYKNSDFTDIKLSRNNFFLTNKIFSPDGDGFEDYLFINYKLDTAGYFGSVWIYSLNGERLRILVNNDLLGTEGFYSWDGTDDNGKKLPLGVYIIIIRYNNVHGFSGKIKLSCTLAGKK